MKAKLIGIPSLMAILSMLLSGCGSQAQPPAATSAPPTAATQQAALPAEGPKIIYGGLGAASDIPTLDPALAEDTASIQIIQETFIGLTDINEETGATQPGMATSWDARTNADGTQTLTFHLRDNVPWVRWNGESVEAVKTCDGSANRLVTAQDFVYGVQRNQDPANASPYAYLLGFVLKGAAEFSNGMTNDFSTVGVKALDDATLEMTFLAPAVYNVQIAGLWVARPQPRWVIEGGCDGALQPRGERWIEPGFFQSYGPFTVKEWIHDSSITLVRNPYWPGTTGIPQSSVDEITLRMLDPTVSLTEYEAGNLDFTLVPMAEMDRVKADASMSKELYVEAGTSANYYCFNTRAPVVDDVRVRRALSLAVDRQSLVDNIAKGSQVAAQWFVVPGVAGAPTLEEYPDLGVKYDPDKAKAELQSYLDEKQTTADKLDLTLMFPSMPGPKVIAEAIQQMWKSTLGVNVKLVSQEWKVYLVTTRGKETPQIYAMAWSQDYPDANNWDREVFAVNGAMNPVDEQGQPVGGINWRNDQFEKLVREAALENDPAQRRDMYAQAEQILVWEDAAILPLSWFSFTILTKPYITRTYGIGGDESFEKWDVQPH